MYKKLPCFDEDDDDAEDMALLLGIFGDEDEEQAIAA